MDIRIARIDDSPWVAKAVNSLATELGGEPLDPESSSKAAAELMSDPAAGLVLIAEIDERPVGVCTLSYQTAIRTLGRYAIVQEMFVSPEFRESGVGARLLNHAHSMASNDECEVVEVGTPAGGSRAEAFYRLNGYTDVGLRMRHTGSD